MTTRTGLLLTEANLPDPYRADLETASWRDGPVPGSRWLDTSSLSRDIAAGIESSVADPPVRGTLIHGDAKDGLGYGGNSTGTSPSTPSTPTRRTTRVSRSALPGRTATRIMAGASPRKALRARRPEPAGAMFCSIDDTLLFRASN